MSELERKPYRLSSNKWFYLGRRGKCSFHDGETNQHVHGIPLKSIMLALQERGLLAQWDSKRKQWKEPQ